MAALTTLDIEYRRINDFVAACTALTNVTGAYLYGIDSNGASVKIAVSAIAGEDYDAQIAALTTKCNNNATLIQSLQTALNGKAAAQHTHNITDVNGLQTALGGKAAASHTHVIGDVAGLQTALNGKADAQHTHTIENVANLQSALDGKAAAQHTHNITDVNGLQTALGGKAAAQHTHQISDIADLSDTLTDHERRIEVLENNEGGGGTSDALKQRNLSAYAGTDGEIVQHKGETTAELHDGWTYKCTLGETVKTIPQGTRYVSLMQNGKEYISDLAIIGNTKKIRWYEPVVGGITYYLYCPPSLDEGGRAAIIGTYVADSEGNAHRIASITNSGNDITSVTLDNGVTLSFPNSYSVSEAIYVFYSETGKAYYTDAGYDVLSADTVEYNGESYIIITEPVGCLFGGVGTRVTTAADIVIRSQTWTQHGTQPPTTVASGDAFLSIINDELGVSIDIAYNSSNQHLELKGKNSAVVSYVDMSQFIVDGMLDDAQLYTTAEQGVTVEVPYLKFTFNVASGKSVIRVSLKDLVDIYDGSNINLTSAFVKAATYSAPAIGDSMDVAIGKLLKGHEDNAAAIAGKQDTLTFDSTPTANSTKPVTSGGIKAAIDSAIGNVPNALKQVDLTTYQGTDGEIVQHTGATTAEYVNGWNYKFTQGGTLPSNEFCIKLQGVITQYQQDVDIAALIGDDRIFFNSNEEVTYYADDNAKLYIGTKTAPAVGDSILGNNYNEAIWEVEEVVKATQPFKVRYNNGNLLTQTKTYTWTWYKNRSGVKMDCLTSWNDAAVMNHPITVNDAWFIEHNGKLYKITLADGAWLGSTDDVDNGGWRQWDSQPSSAADVSTLQTRMTAAEMAISGKQATITGAASTITDSNLTASKILASDANGKVAATSIATTDAEDAVSKRHTQNTDTKIVSGNNKVEVSGSGTAVTGNASVSGDMSVSGDLHVTGEMTVEEIENIKSENNFITLRDGAQTAVASGSLSGTKVENYDGLGNNLLFGTDADGTFRIGDEGGSLEPIATRDEAANLTDGQAMVWDATNQRLVGKTIDITPTTSSTDLVTSGGIDSAIKNKQRVFYAVTETAGATAVKEFTIADFPTETVNGVKTPFKGTIITVTSTNDDATRIAPLQFKINDGGAFPLHYNGTQWTSLSYTSKIFGKTDKRYTYVFDGTCWNWLGDGFESDTQYSAGTGLKLNGTQFSLNVPRVAKSCNSLPGKNTAIIEEYTNGTIFNLPSNHWYHILTMQGGDSNSLFATQLALCINTTAAYYRIYCDGVWLSWKRLDNPTMDSTPTAGNTSNVVSSAGVKTYVDKQVATKSNVVIRQWATQ